MYQEKITHLKPGDIVSADLPFSYTGNKHGRKPDSVTVEKVYETFTVFRLKWTSFIYPEGIEYCEALSNRLLTNVRPIIKE